MCAVSATGTPFGYSSVRLPGSGISGTVPMMMLSSPAPRLISDVTAVSLERTLSLPPSVYSSNRSTPWKLIISVEVTLAWTKPTAYAPVPAASRVSVSACCEPKTTRSSVPEPPPESTMSTPPELPGMIVTT